MKKIKKFVKSNIKVIIAFILGISIAGSIGVYAATVIASSNVEYSNTTSGLTATTVQGAIDEIYEKAKTHCPEGNVCTETWAKIGDYVRMTPTSTSYTTSTSLTGYTSTQTINPSELNLWRVIRINSDGTIEMVSEYVSSIAVYFSGQKGYQNYVGYLNTIAKQYENSNYTVSSRHMGYSNQTPYITDTSQLTRTDYPPSSATNSTTEAQGLGDVGYKTDYNLVNTALGTLVANKVGTTTAKDYWLASRRYSSYSVSAWNFYGRYIGANGSLDYFNSGSLYNHTSSGFNENNCSREVRPILTLKSGIIPSSGNGSSSSPYVLP